MPHLKPPAYQSGTARGFIKIWVKIKWVFGCRLKISKNWVSTGLNPGLGVLDNRKRTNRADE